MQLNFLNALCAAKLILIDSLVKIKNCSSWSWNKDIKYNILSSRLYLLSFFLN